HGRAAERRLAGPQAAAGQGRRGRPMIGKSRKGAAKTGGRILGLGDSLLPLAEGPLSGWLVEPASLQDLAAARMSACDLVLVDADAWEAPALSAALQALAASPAAPPVLLVGEQIPTTVVRNLLRLERS